MTRPPPLVTFSGLDGCGKTTQLDLLEAALRADGYRVRRVWSRGGYTEGVLWLKATARRLLGRRAPSPGPSAARSQALGRPWVRDVWLTVALLDLMRLYGVELRVAALRGDAVLCDRYLWDSLVDFEVNFPGSRVSERLLWRVLVAVSRRPDAAFFLEVDPAEGERRSLAKGDPFPEPLDARRRRRAEYERLKDHFEVLDASRSREALHAAVRAAVRDAMRGGGAAVRGRLWGAEGGA